MIGQKVEARLRFRYPDHISTFAPFGHLPVIGDDSSHFTMGTIFRLVSGLYVERLKQEGETELAMLYKSVGRLFMA